MSSSPLVGTAGWAYPYWNGVVFPKSLRPGTHLLEIVSEHLNTVEINSTFYQHLKPEVAKLWIKKISANPRFLFTAKLHQRFTHGRFLEPLEIAEFKEGLKPLQRANRLGALLMQFPWSFRFTAENREFLIRLRRTFYEFPLAAEMRNASWLAEEAVGTFLDYKIGFCNIDQPEYSNAMPPTSYLTSGIGYVRLHGRNPGNTMGSFDRDAFRTRQHDYLYSAEELEQWKRRVETINRFAERTFVVFNNDSAGKSFVNALQMDAELNGAHSTSPIELRRRYPLQLQNIPHRHAGQQLLFTAA